MSKTYTKEELQAKIGSTAPADRKEIAEVLKSYGKDLAELVKMKNEERVKFILDEQAKKAKGGKAAPAGKAPVGKAAAPVAGKGTKKPVKEPEPEPEEEPEADPEPEEETSQGGGASAEDIGALREEVAALSETVNLMAGFIAELVPLIKETHFINRALVGLDGREEDVQGLQETYYGQPMFAEAEEGNG